MFTRLRKFTVVFLAILQLIAPLVHAHAGEKISGLGLHVPGLEMYGVVQAASYDFSLGHIDSRPIATLLPSPAIEGIIIGVDAGIKDKQVNAAAESDNSYYLHQPAPVFNAAIPPFDKTIPLQSQQFVGRLFIPSLSPRAPPAQ
ncbi:MAG: hypothetical protein EPN17_12190 [Methylobacter sp.]|nr:MAG: hypothetical protein EPN17_12190 [Methylobacter sp.]